jgi:hypothetical protein
MSLLTIGEHCYIVKLLWQKNLHWLHSYIAKQNFDDRFVTLQRTVTAVPFTSLPFVNLTVTTFFVINVGSSPSGCLVLAQKTIQLRTGGGCPGELDEEPGWELIHGAKRFLPR